MNHNVEVEITPTEKGLLIQKRKAAEHPVDRVVGILGKDALGEGVSVDDYIREVRGKGKVITSVDTNVLLDVFIPDDEHLARSRDWLSAAHNAGDVIICDIVYAELVPAFADRGLAGRSAARDRGHTISHRLFYRL